jgi:tetratricopeptide (TPR) repeat protein
LSDIHLTADLLAAVSRGELPARVLTEVGLSHLLNLCPTCRDEFQLWQQQRRRPATDYEVAFQVIPPLLKRHAEEADEKRGRAEKDLRQLLRLGQPERLARIRRANAHFKGLPLAHRLLAAAKEKMPADPRGLHDLAEAAEAVLIRSTQVAGYYDALVRAMAYRANALRAMGKLREADERLASVRGLIRRESVTDTRVYAEVDWIEGGLRKDQRRFAEAEELLGRAALLYEVAGERSEAAHPLLTLGLLYGDRQNLTRAIEATRSALAKLDPETEPRLYLCGRHNLALFLVEGGQYAAASEAMRADEELYRQFADLWTRLRQLWLQGKIAFGTGRLKDAEAAFLSVRDGFVQQGIGYDAAMAALDLALVYLREDRTAEVRRVAEEMVPLFESEDVHPEAAAALLLFQEAARREVATSERVEELKAYLKRARENPELRFRRAGRQGS